MTVYTLPQQQLGLQPQQMYGQTSQLQPQLQGQIGQLQPQLQGQIGQLQPQVYGQFGQVQPQVYGQFGQLQPQLQGQFGQLQPQVYGQFGQVQPQVYGQIGQQPFPFNPQQQLQQPFAQQLQQPFAQQIPQNLFAQQIPQPLVQQITQPLVQQVPQTVAELALRCAASAVAAVVEHLRIDQQALQTIQMQGQIPPHTWGNVLVESARRVAPELHAALSGTQHIHIPGVVAGQNLLPQQQMFAQPWATVQAAYAPQQRGLI